jgi:uncharacterized protein (TIGR00369 family)
MTDPEIPDQTTDPLQRYIDAHGYLSWLGTRVESMDYGTLVMTIPFDEKLTNSRPGENGETPARIHGGIAATLIDTAGGIALRPFLDDPMNGDVATINLNLNYLRPAGDDLTATAEVVRAGESVGVSTVMVESEAPDGESKPVATGQGAYRLFRS